MKGDFLVNLVEFQTQRQIQIQILMVRNIYSFVIQIWNQLFNFINLKSVINQSILIGEACEVLLDNQGQPQEYILFNLGHKIVSNFEVHLESSTWNHERAKVDSLPNHTSCLHPNTQYILILYLDCISEPCNYCLPNLIFNWRCDYHN